MPTRLQLGAARLEELDARVLERFLDKSWMHLGDTEPPTAPRGLMRHYRSFLRSPAGFARLTLLGLLGRLPRTERTTLDRATLYDRTDFRPFHYKKGDRLDFEDDSFDYVFSEHFFHHLFFDEAFALFRECRRILAPRGVIRTVVPDADLRTYEPPEPVGFPDRRETFLAPLKHKTRYSVYMLTEALRLAGFDPIPLRYCDRRGRYVRKDPQDLKLRYEGCPDPAFVFDLSHIMRLDSLIVDGVKRPGTDAPSARPSGQEPARGRV